MSTRVQLHRALSKLGICSRKQAISLILEGKVKVQDRIITQPLTWVELGLDAITVEIAPAPSLSQKISANKPESIYLAMNKPRQVVTTRQDEKKRETVYDLLPAIWKTDWIFPIGRLDHDSEGLLLFTNDGPFADHIQDPKQHIAKQYRVQLNHLPAETELDKLRQGMQVGGIAYRPIGVKREKGQWFLVELDEGKNREIRRLFQAIGYKVTRLIRIAIGPVELGTLPSGAVRELTAIEKNKLEFLPKTSHPHKD